MYGFSVPGGRKAAVRIISDTTLAGRCTGALCSDCCVGRIAHAFRSMCCRMRVCGSGLCGGPVRGGSNFFQLENLSMDHIPFMCYSTSWELCKVGGLPARPLPQGPERARHPEDGRFIHNETGAAVQGCEGTAPSARVGGVSNGHEMSCLEQPRRSPPETDRRRRDAEELRWAT